MTDDIRICRDLAEYCRGRPPMTFEKESADRWIARADALDSLLSRYERMEKALKNIVAFDDDWLRSADPGQLRNTLLEFRHEARAALSPEEK